MTFGFGKADLIMVFPSILIYWDNAEIIIGVGWLFWIMELRLKRNIR